MLVSSSAPLFSCRRMRPRPMRFFRSASEAIPLKSLGWMNWHQHSSFKMSTSRWLKITHTAPPSIFLRAPKTPLRRYRRKNFFGAFPSLLWGANLMAPHRSQLFSLTAFLPPPRKPLFSAAWSGGHPSDFYKPANRSKMAQTEPKPDGCPGHFLGHFSSSLHCKNASPRSPRSGTRRSPPRRTDPTG